MNLGVVAGQCWQNIFLYDDLCFTNQFQGIAEVLDRSGNPLLYAARSLSPLCFFSSLSSSNQPSLCTPANTVITLERAPFSRFESRYGGKFKTNVYARSHVQLMLYKERPQREAA
jgi:hypothetical protein